METLKKEKQDETSTKAVKISGAEAVIRCLLEEGSELAYGYPGGAIMPVYDEIYKQEARKTCATLPYDTLKKILNEYKN